MTYLTSFLPTCKSVLPLRFLLLFTSAQLLIIISCWLDSYELAAILFSFDFLKDWSVLLAVTLSITIDFCILAISRRLC